MHYNLWGRMRKKLVFGIVLVLTLLLLMPSISSLDDNNESEPLDNGEKEKISFISGVCTKFEGEGLLGYRNVELWSFIEYGIDINGVTSYIPFRWYSVDDRSYMRAPIFIGYCYVAYTGRYLVRGIAFGDIEWSG